MYDFFTKVAPCEVHVYLVSGGCARFEQADAAEAEELMAQIQPDKVFGLRHLLLAGSGFVTTYPADAVEQIDFLVEIAPSWPPPPDFAEVAEIAPETYERAINRAQNRAYFETDPLEERWGERPTVYAEVELRSRRTLYLRLTLAPQERESPYRSIGQLMARLTDAPALVGLREEGGVFLLNPANIVRFAAYPTPPPLLCPGAWTATYLPD